MQEYTVKKGDTLREILITDPCLVTTDGWTCQLEIFDNSGAIVIGPTSVTNKTVAQDAFIVSLTPTQTSSLAVESYKVVVELSNNSLTPPVNAEHEFVLNIDPEYESGDTVDLIVLTVAENSFGTYESLVHKLNQMPLLKLSNSVSRRELKGALVQSYYNIGLLALDFGLYTDPLLASEYTADDLSSLTASQTDALLRAQLVESNMLLGGNPIEDRRRMGLLSDSVGESTHFFRTRKPIEMPVYKETVKVLQGYISWNRKISRG